MKVKSLFAPLFILLWLFSVQASAQFEHVDARIGLYPKKFSTSANLAARIAKDFTSDRERVRAAYTWVATNIAYDMAEYRRGNTIAYKYTSEADRIRKEKAFREALISRTLKTGKGVCEGYASLIQDLCRHFGLDAQIVAGTSRSDASQIGMFPDQSDHAWNVVKVNGQWELLDATWGAGSIDGSTGRFRYSFTDAYFMPDPARFFMNHFPQDRKWLLVDRTPSQFAGQPLYHPSYVKSQYKIDRQDGHLANHGAFDFGIANLSSRDRVYFATDKKNVLQPVRENNGRFVVPINREFSGIVTIFVNEKPIVSYKISRPNA